MDGAASSVSLLGKMNSTLFLILVGGAALALVYYYQKQLSGQVKGVEERTMATFDEWYRWRNHMSETLADMQHQGQPVMAPVASQHHLPRASMPMQMPTQMPMQMPVQQPMAPGVMGPPEGNAPAHPPRFGMTQASAAPPGGHESMMLPGGAAAALAPMGGNPTIVPTPEPIRDNIRAAPRPADFQARQHAQKR